MSTGPVVRVEGGAPTPRPRRTTPGWLAWPLVALCAVPVAVSLVLAQRVLGGSSTFFGGDDPPVPARERVLLVLQVVGLDVQLVLPLLGLAGLAWWALHARDRRPLPSAAIRTGAVLAAAVAAVAAGSLGLLAFVLLSDGPGPDEEQFFGQQPLFELFGQRAAGTLLLVALAGALAAALWSAARAPEPPEAELEERAEQQGDDRDDGRPADDGQPVAEPDAAPGTGHEPDPHARYRRPPS